MADAPRYLVDKSALEQGRYDERARRRLHSLRATGQLASCVVTVAAILYSARNADDLQSRRASLDEFTYLAETPNASQGVVDIMAALSRRGQHRLPMSDVIIAAIGDAHGAIVLHYDSDFERIAAVTGQRHEWIVPRGTGHGARGG